MIRWVIIAMMAAVGFYSIYVSGQSVIDSRALWARGEKAAVTSIDELTLSTSPVRQLLNLNYYSAKIGFVTKEGQKISVHKSIPDDRIAHLQSGFQATIEYLPDNPRVIRFSGESIVSLSPLLLGIILLTCCHFLVQGARDSSE